MNMNYKVICNDAEIKAKMPLTESLNTAEKSVPELKAMIEAQTGFKVRLQVDMEGSTIRVTRLLHG